MTKTPPPSRRFDAVISRLILVVAFLAPAIAATPADAAESTPRGSRPNIVYVLCDDLGYGDVAALNPVRGKISTPNIDRLASQGIAFTNAHSGSSVCTPTRYGILTGRYAWRSQLQRGVLQGMSPPLLAQDRLTVPELLRENGYATAIVGKWHLGLAFGPNPWTDPIADGPVRHGFDSFYGISASLDMPPFVYIENDRVTEVPTVEKKWIRAGPAAASFEAVNVLPDLTRKACDYIAGRAADTAKPAVGKPFFLYLPLASPHTPIVPSPQWEGRSGLGAFGDFVMQTDAAIGEVLAALDKAGVADDTLVIVTSDNGCAPAANVGQLEAQGHYPSAGFRGYKADIWEGGHRVPFIARWPGRIAPGGRSDGLVCLTDLMATCAEIVGATLPADAGEDSQSMLALMTKPGSEGRESAIHHSVDGVFAIRRGKWKLCLCAGSGGWAAPREAAAARQNLPKEQLYDMEADPGEQTNLAARHPEIVRELTALLQKQIDEGRSTPGPRQANDAPIELRKKPRPATRAAGE